MNKRDVKMKELKENVVENLGWLKEIGVVKEKKEKKIEETEKKKKVNGKKMEEKSSQQKLVVKFQWKKK